MLDKNLKYFILENVPHLKKHDREKTWKIILGKLQGLDYDVKETILSPHEFGIPQIRKRIFIVGFLDKDKAEAFLKEILSKPMTVNQPKV